MHIISDELKNEISSILRSSKFPRKRGAGKLLDLGPLTEKGLMKLLEEIREKIAEAHSNNEPNDEGKITGLESWLFLEAPKMFKRDIADFHNTEKFKVLKEFAESCQRIQSIAHRHYNSLSEEYSKAIKKADDELAKIK